MATRDLDSIRKVVAATLAEEFDHIKILDVQVHEDTDLDGEKVLLINVIFEGAPKDVDAKKLSGALRHLRPKLSEIDESAIPLLSFISQADWRRHKRATA